MACLLPLVARHCVKKGPASWGWGDQVPASARPLQRSDALVPVCPSAPLFHWTNLHLDLLKPVTFNLELHNESCPHRSKAESPSSIPRYRVLSFVVTLSEFSLWLVRLKDGRVKTFLATSLKLIPKLRGV